MSLVFPANPVRMAQSTTREGVIVSETTCPESVSERELVRICQEKVAGGKFKRRTCCFTLKFAA